MSTVTAPHFENAMARLGYRGRILHHLAADTPAPTALHAGVHAALIEALRGLLEAEDRLFAETHDHYAGYASNSAVLIAWAERVTSLAHTVHHLDNQVRLLETLWRDHRAT